MKSLSERGQVQLIVPIDRATRKMIRAAAEAFAVPQGTVIERAVRSYLDKTMPRLLPAKERVNGR